MSATSGKAEGLRWREPLKAVKNPYGVAVDTAGNLCVADFGNNTVRKGIPTSLLPPPLLQSPILGTGQFGFGMSGAAGFTMNIETTADFTNWQTVGTYIFDGGTNYFLGGTLSQGIQFYRAHLP